MHERTAGQTSDPQICCLAFQDIDVARVRPDHISIARPLEPELGVVDNGSLGLGQSCVLRSAQGIHGIAFEPLSEQGWRSCIFRGRGTRTRTNVGMTVSNRAMQAWRRDRRTTICVYFLHTTIIHHGNVQARGMGAEYHKRLS